MCIWRALTLTPQHSNYNKDMLKKIKEKLLNSTQHNI